MTKERRGFTDVGDVEFREVAIDDDWRKRALKRIDEMNQAQWRLGEHLGCGQGVISQVLDLKGKQEKSKYVLPISAALGIAPPLHIEVGLLSVEAVKFGHEALVRSQIEALRAVLAKK